MYPLGYTLHTIDLNGFDQSDSLFVSSDDLPQLALEADYGSGGYAVVGTRYKFTRNFIEQEWK